MVEITKFSDFKKTNSLFFREHDRIIKKYNIDFISLKGVKIPFICLYEIVFVLFENNSINLKISDIILLTLSAVGSLSNENKDLIKILFGLCKDKNILDYYKIVLNTIKSLKNLMNIVFRQDGAVIQNIEQSLKYRYSIDALNITLKYIRIEKIKIDDFSYWYIVDNRNKESKNLIEYVKLNYYK